MLVSTVTVQMDDKEPLLGAQGKPLRVWWRQGKSGVQRRWGGISPRVGLPSPRLGSPH